MPKATSGGGKKIGRWGRKPSHTRYKAEKRWERNKEIKIARHEKIEVRANAKRLKRMEVE